ncbi:kelch-like protein 24 [Mizuhopecten yessoensis]|uniref:kelch-like protein 24 n=1 Tax=Mizuhopecten yessoensis TaxID=6573 RepID=UPI000B45E158|nr:kelch-like protein 24 [Mizuhopecten yessoensis]
MSSGSAPVECSVNSGKRARRFNRKLKSRGKKHQNGEKSRHVEVKGGSTLTSVTSKPVISAGDTDYVNTLMAGLRRLEGDTDLCDVTVIVEDREFSCHLMILYTFSNYFRSHLQSSTKEHPNRTIRLDMVEADTMETVLHFLYTGEVKVTKDTARDLLFTAAYLRIACLQRLLEQRHAQFLGSENVLDYWQLTDLYPDYHILKKKCERFAILCFQTLLETSKFVHLTLSKLSILVFSENLNVSDENIVFDAVMKWILHDFAARRCHARKLVDSIRLPLIDGARYKKLKATFPDLFVEPLNDYIREAEMFHGDFGGQMRYSSPRTELRPGGATEKGIIVITGSTSPRGVGIGLPPTEAMNVPYISEYGEVNPRDLGKHMKIWCFSFMTRRWKQLCNLPEYPGRQFASCTHGLYDIFLSGERGMYRYSTRENTWVVCEPVPGRGRMSHGMEAIKDSLYILGGKTCNGFSDYARPVEVYSVLHEKWESTSLCQITIPVSDFYSVAVRNKIFIFSGFTQGMSHERHVTHAIQCIDVNTRTCTIVCHTAVLGPVVSLNTEIHQVAGRNLVKHWPGCRAFVKAGTLALDCSNARLVRVRSKILIVGATQGTSECFSDVIMEFDFNKRAKKLKTWREKIPEVREDMTCHVLLIPNMSLTL